MKIHEARKKILENLKKAGLILDQKQISHIINVHDKCGTEIEFLPTEQWFIKVLDKKKELIKQGKKIKWYPNFMRKRFENWIDGLEWDWNISRDRHFGVSIPAWYCKKCDETIIADEKELPLNPSEIEKKCSKCKGRAEPEIKVLDTWATSSLTPQIASSLVGNKIKLPYSLRPQAHDIIRTWAFYTIVKAYLHENKIPWENVVVSGFVRLEGEKMSKSKGNIIEPRDAIQKYGSDALRFWAAGSKLGEDLNYQEKFVFMSVGKSKPKKPKKLESVDKLFLQELSIVVNNATSYFKGYEYSKAKMEVEQFFWKSFTDNYLEFVKKRIYQGTGNEKLSAQYTLYRSLLAILKLIAPITPFITEEIYQTYYRKHEKDKSIHLSDWPKYDKEKKSKDWGILINIMSKIRQEKTKKHVSLNFASGAVSIPAEEYQIIKKYEEPFLAASGAICIKAGKEFNVEFPKTEHKT
jgi:valyl-tRNA synthetase